MRPQIVTLLTLVCSFFTAIPMLGQPSAGGQGPPPPDRGPTLPELPIDDNILVLVCIAIIYGVYIAYKNNAITNSPE